MNRFVGCRCIQGSGACSLQPAVRRQWPERARSCRNGTCCHRMRRRRRAICSRRSIDGTRLRHTSPGPRNSLRTAGPESRARRNPPTRPLSAAPSSPDIRTASRSSASPVLRSSCLRPVPERRSDVRAAFATPSSSRRSMSAPWPRPARAMRSPSSGWQAASNANGSPLRRAQSPIASTPLRSA